MTILQALSEPPLIEHLRRSLAEVNSGKQEAVYEGVAELVENRKRQAGSVQLRRAR